MKRPITIQDVAREARVSRTTVSRVLNRDATVHPVIRETVSDAIRRLDYRPNPIARSLKSQRSHLVATVFSELSYPAVWGYLAPFERELRQRGLTSILVNSGSDPELERTILREVDELRVDGIIWYPVSYPESFDLAPDMRASVVVVANDGGGAFSSVSIDVPALADLAVSTLVGLGHRRIGYIHQRRFPGFSLLGSLLAKQMEVAGGAVEPGWDRWFARPEDCLAGLTEQLKVSAPPTALLVRSTMLPPTYLALARAGLRIPDDVSVISVSEPESAMFMMPPTDAFVWSAEERAVLTVDLLSRTIAGQVGSPEQLVQGVTYVQRESTARLAGAGGSVDRD